MFKHPPLLYITTKIKTGSRAEICKKYLKIINSFKSKELHPQKNKPLENEGTIFPFGDPIFKKFVIYSRGILADNPNPKHGIKERRNLTLQWNTDYAE